MGFWKELAFLAGFGKKDFSSGGWNGQNLNLWDPRHPLNAFTGSYSADRETIENDFEGYIRGAFKANGPVYACMQARMMPFAEARFMWRTFDNGRPGQLFGDEAIRILDYPFPCGTTGELLQRMIQDADLAGNFYATLADDAGNIGRAAKGRSGERIVRLRPDWVQIVVGTSRQGAKGANRADARVLGYNYKPQGHHDGEIAEEVFLTTEEVCHFSPYPDPAAKFRGMSWLTPILREIQGDSLATLHKKQFFENSAVPSVSITFDKETSQEDFDEFVASFKAEHQGAWKAYQPLFLMGGADVTPLSADFKQLEFTQTIGKGESRIAVAAGVPSSWVGFSEGLMGSGLNSQGVYQAARRRFADATIRPLWRIAAASLERLVDPPDRNTRLWYDDRDIAFLREDATARAEIMRTDLSAVEMGIRAGFEADVLIDAVKDYDLEKLKGHHTGLVSVQMMPPKDANDTSEQDAATAQIDAGIIATLVTAGFSEESTIEAIEADYDWTKLQRDPLKEEQQRLGVEGERAANNEIGKPPPKDPNKPDPNKPKPAAPGKPSPKSFEDLRAEFFKDNDATGGGS